MISLSRHNINFIALLFLVVVLTTAAGKFVAATDDPSSASSSTSTSTSANTDDHAVDLKSNINTYTYFLRRGTTGDEDQRRHRHLLNNCDCTNYQNLIHCSGDGCSSSDIITKGRPNGCLAECCNEICHLYPDNYRGGGPLSQFEETDDVDIRIQLDEGNVEIDILEKKDGTTTMTVIQNNNNNDKDKQQQPEQSVQQSIQQSYPQYQPQPQLTEGCVEWKNSREMCQMFCKINECYCSDPDTWGFYTCLCCNPLQLDSSSSSNSNNNNADNNNVDEYNTTNTTSDDE